jgi:hypothetical protein
MLSTVSFSFLIRSSSCSAACSICALCASAKSVSSCGMNFLSLHALNLPSSFAPSNISSRYEFAKHSVMQWGIDHIGASFHSELIKYARLLQKTCISWPMWKSTGPALDLKTFLSKASFQQSACCMASECVSIHC